MSEQHMAPFRFARYATEVFGTRPGSMNETELARRGIAATESEIGTWNSGKSDGTPHEGFYTQEHYPGMTEKSLAEIVELARERWPLGRVTVIHRIGEMWPGEEIVFVGVTSAHRSSAFAAGEFIMDYLKSRAPFWKREATPEGERWVDARDSDRQAAERW